VRTGADAVVIGGGAMGTSTAWHLRRLGLDDVVVVERETLASGSTGKAAGGIRTQFADELNIRIALRSMAEFEHMEEIEWRRNGYLFLLDDEDDLYAFRQALALQQSLGVPSIELSVDDVIAKVPQVATDGLVGATFCSLDGYATPEAVVHWYAREVRVLQGCEVTGIDVIRGRIRAVETSRGRIETTIVVCCAGVWSPEIGAMVGIDLPVRGEKRWIWFSPRDGGLPDSLPLTIDFSTGFYVHREGPGVAFGGRENDLELIEPHVTRRLPILTELPVQSAWWGWYEQSPDQNAIVGETEEVSRFLYATGFSGHGFQQAPAIGEHIAQLVTGQIPSLDLSAFSQQRFTTGEGRPERFVV
jgi:sarcosine oxidase subunit beta